VEGIFVLAVYDLDGKLAKDEMVEFSTDADKSGTVTFTLNSGDYPASGFSVKAFCWNKNYIPLVGAVEPVSFG
jgi:hypothetical protein